MKILKAEVTNFGSYKNLEINLHNKGLTLVYGPTGAGKSTLEDIVPWILFGVSAKGGNVDDICSWKAEGAPTTGTVTLSINNKPGIVTRIRGQGKNDLYYWFYDMHMEPQRGKDITDTQKLLNQVLRFDAQTYTAATCFNEFSDAGNFFLAKAKDRRAVFEKIANWELPTALTLKLSAARKNTETELKSNEISQAKLLGEENQLDLNIKANNKHIENWVSTQKTIIAALKAKRKNFEAEKNYKLEELRTKSWRFEAEKTKKIDKLVEEKETFTAKIFPIDDAIILPADASIGRCSKCGNTVPTPEIEAHKAQLETNTRCKQKIDEINVKIKEIEGSKNYYEAQYIEMTASQNHYDEHIKLEKNKVNPHVAYASKLRKEQKKIKDLLKNSEALVDNYVVRLSALQYLQKMCTNLRGVLLEKAVNKIQSDINGYICKYFDGEFTVGFDPDGDSLEIIITKNGYQCPYKQLSKGQRQILRLCFAVSIMKATADKVGIHFNLLSFDEALDGLDCPLKLKAYRLFEHLNYEHDSVFVVEHNAEFQELFCNKIKVSLVDDESQLEYE